MTRATLKRSALLALLTFGVAMLWAPVPNAVYATKPIAQQEEAACTVCHDKPGSKLMTDKGKYYELLGTLDGYDHVTMSFGECTYCHLKKPGSTKLTKTGKHFETMVNDMKGLSLWLETIHPTTPEDIADPTEDSAP